MAKKFLKDIKIDFISLVRKGANNRTTIFKSADTIGSEELVQVQAIKKDDVKQMIYGIVYAPDEVDAHGHQAPAPEIEKAAYGFMKTLKAQNVDKKHSNVADGGAFVAESWIVRKGDPMFSSETPGAWAVGIKCEDADLYAEAKENFPAISMHGTANIITKSEGEGADAEGLLSKIMNLFKEQKISMEDEQMDEKTLKQVGEMISAAITKSADEAKKAAEPDTIKKAMETMTANMTALVGEVEKISKQSPGTKQDQNDTVEIIKEQVDLGERIAAIANGTVEKR